MPTRIIQGLAEFRTYVRNTLEDAKFHWEFDGQKWTRYWNQNLSSERNIFRTKHLWSNIASMLGMSVEYMEMEPSTLQICLSSCSSSSFLSC